MKSQRKILSAFILNFAFSVFELIGGIFTGSVAIISDSVHDMGDAISIGISYFLEKEAKKQPDEKYTFGYARYSVLGGVIACVILLSGSLIVILNSFSRIIHPHQVNYDGMIVFAIIGVCINFAASFFTDGGESLNQKAVNLHMLEDALGWVVVLAGAVAIKITGITVIDPVISIGVSVYIMIKSFDLIKEAVNLFLEKSPNDINVNEIKKHISDIECVCDVHHIHVWSMDGKNNYATMHVVTCSDFYGIKEIIRNKLKEHGIGHVTLELETKDEECFCRHCRIEYATSSHCLPHH